MHTLTDRAPAATAPDAEILCVSHFIQRELTKASLVPSVRCDRRMIDIAVGECILTGTVCAVRNGWPAKVMVHFDKRPYVVPEAEYPAIR